MRTVAAALAALVIASSPLSDAVGQAPPAVTPTSQAERNLADFDFVVSTIRQNYAGWHTKVTDATRPELNALTSRLRSRAGSASDSELLALLTQWIAFFRDRHTSIGNAAPAAAAGGNAAAYPAVDVDEQALRARLQALGKARHPVEGIWDIAGSYRVGVIRDGSAPDTFRAVVLTTTSSSWKPGQVKADLVRRSDGGFDMVFRAGDHSEARTTAKLVADNDGLLVEGWAAWLREWPAPPRPVALRRIVPPADLVMRQLSPKTLWLRIPDFNGSRAKPLRDLLEANGAALQSTPNLIIDLRNNGGGSDYVYAPLVPLLYTRPIVTIGVELRSGPDNIAIREKNADGLRAEAPDVAAELDAQNKLMRQNPGKYVRLDRRQFAVERVEAVPASPKRVAVLVDGAISTGEEFLLLARQSRKTTLFGQRNSGGVLDFSNVIGMPTPSGRYMLRWATSRSLRLPEYPVDPDGIPPDVRIPEEVADPVAYAAKWLERQVD